MSIVTHIALPDAAQDGREGYGSRKSKELPLQIKRKESDKMLDAENNLAGGKKSACGEATEGKGALGAKGAPDETEVSKDATSGGITAAAYKKKLIYICSPYRPVQKIPKKAKPEEAQAIRDKELQENIDRAKMACRIVTALGFIPMAPHLYFTQFLDDSVSSERDKGMAYGLQWLGKCDELWVFGSRTSAGMAEEIAKAKSLGKEVRNFPEPDRVVEILLKEVNRLFGVGQDEGSGKGAGGGGDGSGEEVGISDEAVSNSGIYSGNEAVSGVKDTDNENEQRIATEREDHNE